MNPEFEPCLECGDTLDRREYLTENLCDSCAYFNHED